MDEPVTKSTFKAADAGNADAQYLIGFSLLYGENGCSQNQEQAEIYLHKAVHNIFPRREGTGKACLLLAEIHSKGMNGWSVDLPTAHMWATMAMQYGAAGAYQVLSEITNRKKLSEVGIIDDVTESMRKRVPLSHAKMANLIRKGNYSTLSNAYGPVMDDRPKIYLGPTLPVRYVQYVQDVDGGGRREYAVWPEGDIQGYLENAKPKEDMLLFPCWRDIQRWEAGDRMFDYEDEGWVPHVDLGFR